MMCKMKNNNTNHFVESVSFLQGYANKKCYLLKVQWKTKKDVVKEW